MSSTPLIDDAETGGGNGASGPLQGVDYGAFDDAGDDHVAKYDDASADASAAAKGSDLRTVQALVDDNIIAEDSYSVCEHDEDLGGGGDVDDTRRLFSSMQLSSHAPGTRLIGYGHGAELLSSPAAAANGVLESSEACCEYAWRVGAVIETEVPWKSLLINLICATGCILFIDGMCDLDEHIRYIDVPFLVNFSVACWAGVFVAMALLLTVISMPRVQREWTYAEYDKRYHPRRYLAHYWIGRKITAYGENVEGATIKLLTWWTKASSVAIDASFYIAGLLVYADFWVSFVLIIVSLLVFCACYGFTLACTLEDDINTVLDDIPVFLLNLFPSFKALVNAIDDDIIYSCNHAPLYLLSSEYMVGGAVLAFVAHIPQLLVLADTHRAYEDAHSLIMLARRLELYRGLARERGLTLRDKKLDVGEAKLRETYEADRGCAKCCGLLVVLSVITVFIVVVSLPSSTTGSVDYVISDANLTYAPTPTPGV